MFHCKPRPTFFFFTRLPGNPKSPGKEGQNFKVFFSLSSWIQVNLMLLVSFSAIFFDIINYFGPYSRSKKVCEFAHTQTEKSEIEFWMKKNLLKKIFFNIKNFFLCLILAVKILIFERSKVLLIQKNCFQSQMDVIIWIWTQKINSFILRH